jgi:hypothetical protein
MPEKIRADLALLEVAQENAVDPPRQVGLSHSGSLRRSGISPWL